MRLPNICGLLTASALLIGANSANALILEIDDLATMGTDVTLVDGAGFGVINYNSVDDGAVGSFSVVVSTGLGAPAVGGPNDAEIDLSVQATSSGASTLQVTLTDEGLSIPLGDSERAAAVSSFSINANSAGSSATVESFIRVGASTVFEALSSLTGVGEVNLSETILWQLTAGALFDIRTVITLDYTKLGFATADANLNISAVPLPAALPLFLTALIGLGFVGRQRRRQAA